LLKGHGQERLTVPLGATSKHVASASQPIIIAISCTKAFVSLEAVLCDRSLESFALRQGWRETWTLGGNIEAMRGRIQHARTDWPTYGKRNPDFSWEFRCDMYCTGSACDRGELSWTPRCIITYLMWCCNPCRNWPLGRWEQGGTLWYPLIKPSGTG